MQSFHQRFVLTFTLLLSLLLVRASGAQGDGPARPMPMLRDVHRIVFLGDSITQAGDYVTDIECWLVAHGIKVEVMNLGLGSETVSDLTAEENAAHLQAHGFGRPFVSERLNRILAATKPDLLFACYGMNDGTGLPSSQTGADRFAAAVTNLRVAAAEAGVKRIVICTPPVDDRKGGGEESLVRYTTWLQSKRAASWEVVDLHTPMRRALDARRAHDPAFKFAKDGVHPGREGHWLLAREILTQFFGATLDGVASAESLFPARGLEIRKLIHERMRVRFEAWMTQIGHGRPGVAGGPKAKPGLPLREAEAKVADLTAKIDLALKNHNSAPTDDAGKSTPAR